MKLRLGPLPNTNTVKMSIFVPVELKAELERYAEIHSATWGQQTDAQTLIPRMLAQFVAHDPAFRAAKRAYPAE